MKNYDVLNELVPKTQELHRAIFDKGYEQGYNEGIRSHNGERDSIYYSGYDDRHKDGLNDAWECAKKIVHTSSCDREMNNIFGDDFYYAKSNILNKYSASEAIIKIKEYEEKQKANNEIKVGDEVYLLSLSKDYPRIVLSLYTEDDGLGMKARTMLSGGTIDIKPVSKLKRTGRHFDQIAEVLEQLKGEKNNG